MREGEVPSLRFYWGRQKREGEKADTKSSGRSRRVIISASALAAANAHAIPSPV